ncbi:MAG: helix-turn-helix transcriptional regulator [Betaproteobacteria bacterium]|nr:helix-turn-helix transcriptional regulator [Betaproteobacteria bacterium]
MSIGDRLREERERLGLSQTAMAQLFDTSKRVQISYEQGRTYPNANYLAVLAEKGVDVFYVVTGKRLKMYADPPPAAPALTRQEEMLVNNYRQTSEEAKKALLRTSLAFAQEKVAKKPE